MIRTIRSLVRAAASFPRARQSLDARLRDPDGRLGARVDRHAAPHRRTGGAVVDADAKAGRKRLVKIGGEVVDGRRREIVDESDDSQTANRLQSSQQGVITLSVRSHPSTTIDGSTL